MAINIQRVSELETNGVNVLVYGESGTGKTYMVSTLTAPMIISCESGLLSLKKVCAELGIDIPYIPIASMSDLMEVYRWALESQDAQSYYTLVLDSLTEIAELLLVDEKSGAKDARQAYGETQDQITQMIRGFQRLPRFNKYFTAQLDKGEDELKRIVYGAAMPGRKLGAKIPHFFDEVFAYRRQIGEDGSVSRILQCHHDGTWFARDRSGMLDMWEQPNLDAIFAKIAGRANG